MENEGGQERNPDLGGDPLGSVMHGNVTQRTRTLQEEKLLEVTGPGNMAVSSIDNIIYALQHFPCTPATPQDEKGNFDSSPENILFGLQSAANPSTPPHGVMRWDASLPQAQDGEDVEDFMFSEIPPLLSEQSPLPEQSPFPSPTESPTRLVATGHEKVVNEVVDSVEGWLLLNKYDPIFLQIVGTNTYVMQCYQCSGDKGAPSSFNFVREYCIVIVSPDQNRTIICSCCIAKRNCPSTDHVSCSHIPSSPCSCSYGCSRALSRTSGCGTLLRVHALQVWLALAALAGYDSFMAGFSIDGPFTQWLSVEQVFLQFNRSSLMHTCTFHHAMLL